MAALKILQLSASDVTADVLLRPLIETLRQDGHQVDVACADDGRTERLRAEGWTVHTIPIERKVSLRSNVLTTIALTKLLREGGYDAIHVHTPVAAMLGRVAARIARTEHILYTAHGFYFHERMNRLVYGAIFWMEKIMAMVATDWLLLQSEEDYSLAKARHFKKADRLMHLGNGIDITRFTPTYKQVDPERLRFLFVGRIVAEKGVIELLKAFDQVSQRYPEATLTIAGELMKNERDQETMLRFQELVSANKQINYVGFVQDMPDLFKRHDVFLLPSYREGLPRSILEAMASGLPVIATDIRGCREEVEDGQSGFLVPVEDVGALASAIERFIVSPELVERFGRHGRDLVESRFDEQLVLKRQTDLFKQLGSEGRA